MSKAASAFSSRRSFVNRNRLSIDFVAVFGSKDATSQTVSRGLIRIQRISEQNNRLLFFESQTP
jgi:hypothetical protein